MASSTPASASAGFMVALLGVIPLAWFLLHDAGETDAVPETTTTVAIEQLERTPVEIAPPEVTELDESISRVLYADGSAEAVGEQQTELPPEVVRVLVYYDVTLTVPVAAANQGEKP